MASIRKMEQIVTIEKERRLEVAYRNVLVVEHLYKSFGENNVLVDFELKLKKERMWRFWVNQAQVNRF